MTSSVAQVVDGMNEAAPDDIAYTYSHSGYAMSYRERDALMLTPRPVVFVARRAP